MNRSTIIDVRMRAQLTNPFSLLSKREYAEQRRLRHILLPVFKSQQSQEQKIYLRYIKENTGFFLS